MARQTAIPKNICSWKDIQAGRTQVRTCKQDDFFIVIFSPRENKNQTKCDDSQDNFSTLQYWRRWRNYIYQAATVQSAPASNHSALPAPTVTLAGGKGRVW